MNSRKTVLEFINRVYRNGLTTTSGGNLSFRDENNDIFITPSGKDKGTLEESDIAQVKPNGEKIGDYKPSMELPFHSKIYKLRPEINGVVHVHSPYLVSYSLLSSAPSTKTCWQFYKTSRQVGLSLYDIPGSIELGEQIAKFIEKGFDSIMMQNHGVVCIGKDMSTAYIKLENLECCAKTCLYAARLKGAQELSNEVLNEYIEYKPFIKVVGRNVINNKDSGNYINNKESSNDKGNNCCDKNFKVVKCCESNDYAKERQQICDFCARTLTHGYFTAGIGVISMRVGGNAFLITPNEFDRGMLKSEDIVLVQDDIAYGGEPDTQWALHKAIYEEKNYVNSVFSGCPPAIMAYAVSDTPIDSRTLPESYIMMREVERLETLSDIRDIKKVSATFSPSTHVVMVKNSCIITTGETITKAFDRFEVSEITARNYLLAGVLGTAKPITEAEIDKIDRYFSLPKKI